MATQISYNLSELIGKSRDQIEFSEAELYFIAQSIANHEMSDAQIGAFAMAVLCNKLSKSNGMSLTKALRDSGDVLTWDVDGPIVDKHSTGGVGDGVSLLLAPILAACGAFVPMISGRGLGHTGGTLDKLEAIEGFSTQRSTRDMQSQLARIGCVMAGQSPNLVPADGRLYAIRDITGTVPSIDLITASILSKKLAAGLQSLVLDVKFGLGAFMKTHKEATTLAKRLVEVSTELGCKATAVLTNMNRPLASTAGNAVEVRDVIGMLKGNESDSSFLEVTRKLCIEALLSAGLVGNEIDGSIMINEALSSGRAAEKFEQMCAEQGGASQLKMIEKYLAEAKYIKEIKLPIDREFNGFDAYKMGMVVVELGGGRKKHSDKIDYSVGITAISKKAKSGDVIAIVHARDEADFLQAEHGILDAILNAPIEEKLILECIK